MPSARPPRSAPFVASATSSRAAVGRSPSRRPAAGPAGRAALPARRRDSRSGAAAESSINGRKRVDGSAHGVSDDEVAAVGCLVVPLPGDALVSRRQSKQGSVSGEVGGRAGRRLGEGPRSPTGKPRAGESGGEDLIGVHRREANAAAAARPGVTGLLGEPRLARALSVERVWRAVTAPEDSPSGSSSRSNGGPRPAPSSRAWAKPVRPRCRGATALRLDVARRALLVRARGRRRRLPPDLHPRLRRRGAGRRSRRGLGGALRRPERPPRGHLSSADAAKRVPELRERCSEAFGVDPEPGRERIAAHLDIG